MKRNFLINYISINVICKKKNTIHFVDYILISNVIWCDINKKLYVIYDYNIRKYIKKLLRIPCYILKR